MSREMIFDEFTVFSLFGSHRREKQYSKENNDGGALETGYLRTIPLQLQVDTKNSTVEAPVLPLDGRRI